jgi:glycosyltransferase involved in cell wall biosynthesis
VRILHVVTTLDVGGAEVHLIAQVRGQAARGHAVRVLYLKGKGTLAPETREAGAGFVGRAGPAAIFRSARWAEIVHSHLLKADMATAVLATLAGRRSCLVSSKHNDEQVLKRPLVSLVHRILGRLPARTIVLSDHVGRFFAEHGGVDPAKTRRIYYGIDPAPFERAAARPASEKARLRASLGIPPEAIVFVCVARFAPQKAHEILLRALAKIERADVRLLLVGDDPFGDGRKRAEEIARELRLGERALFTGIRRDVPDLLAISDAFVMASRWEGLGLVFLEAMAASLPVVATRVSAVPEVVVDGETGLLVPVDDPDALAAALARLAGDADLRRRLGDAGARRVRERFGLERMVDETLSVYREVKSPLRTDR